MRFFCNHTNVISHLVFVVRCGYEFCYNCGEERNKETGTCAKHCPTLEEAYFTRQGPARGYYDYDDEEDYEDDNEDYDDYEDDEDFDYGFGGFPFGFGQNMNGAKGSFDPYSELPAGNNVPILNLS